MTATSRLLARSRALIEAGHWQDALRVLEAVIRTAPEDDAAWSLYLSAPPDDIARREALRQLVWTCTDNPVALRRAVAALKRLTAFAATQPPSTGTGAPAQPRTEQTANRAAGTPRGRQAPPHSKGPAARAGIARRAWPALAAKLAAAAASLEAIAHRALRPLLAMAFCLVAVGMGLWFSRVERAHLSRLRAEIQDLQAVQQEREATMERVTHDYNTLLTNYYALRSEKQDLAADYADLAAEHGRLQSEYGHLQTEYTQLRTEHNDLIGSFNALRVQFGDLQQTYDTLTSDYDTLRDVAITPPYIVIEGRRVHLAFVKLDGSIVQWVVPFDSLETSIERGYEARDDWMLNTGSLLKLRMDNGQVATVTDHSHFVDTSPFVSVVATLYYAAPDDETFIRELWHIVTQLSTYTSEEGEVPRYPLETLLAGGGDCEDTSILLASMLSAAPVGWKVELMYIDSDHPEYPVNPNHVIVRVDTGARTYLIETTSSAIMEPYTDVRGWTVRVD